MWRCAVHGTWRYGKQLYLDADVGGLRCRAKWEEECAAAARARNRRRESEHIGTTEVAPLPASDTSATSSSPMDSLVTGEPSVAATEVAPLPAGGATVINLFDVKEEPIDECVHTPVDSEGNAWPCTRDLEAMIWSGNEYADNSVANLIQTLDATLFQHNMRGWAEMQRLMLVNKKAFKFFYMNTASGHRGFMMVCKQCDQLVKVRWLKNDPWDSEALETCRSMIRQFLGCGTHASVKKQRIV